MWWCPECGYQPKAGWGRHCWERIPGASDKEERAAVHMWQASCGWRVHRTCGTVCYARNHRTLFILARDAEHG